MSLLYKLNKNLGILLFKTPNIFTYSVYNYLYNKYVVNLDEADDDIKKFHKNGFFKPNLNFKDEAAKLKKTLDKDKSINNNAKIQFILNENSKTIIRDILNSPKFEILRNKIEKYFNSNVYLVNVEITRNLPIDKDFEHKKNLYSNNYHVDYYIMNYFKMFINLQDVNKSDGPLHLYSKKNSKKFIIKNVYKNRENYKLDNERDLGLFENTGLLGDIFVCSTPQCLHRASSPAKGKKRDMLFLTFAATNEVNSNNDILAFEKNYYRDIWSKENKLAKILCKPKSIRKQIFLFKNFLNKKIEN